MSFFSKARAFTLGNLHELLDASIDANSPAVLKQYVRDLETGIEQLKFQAATAGGNVRTLNREIGDLKNNIEGKTNSIKTRLASPNVTTTDTVVRSWAAQVTEWQKELAQKVDQELPSAVKVTTDLDSAVAKLEVKHTAMVSQVRRLESAVHTAAAKNKAVDALKQATDLAGGAGDVNIDNLSKRVQAKADVADEKFDRAMNSDTLAESAEQSSEVDAFLSNLK